MSDPNGLSGCGSENLRKVAYCSNVSHSFPLLKSLNHTYVASPPPSGSRIHHRSEKFNPPTFFPISFHHYPHLFPLAISPLLPFLNPSASHSIDSPHYLSRGQVAQWCVPSLILKVFFLLFSHQCPQVTLRTFHIFFYLLSTNVTSTDHFTDY